MCSALIAENLGSPFRLKSGFVELEMGFLLSVIGIVYD